MLTAKDQNRYSRQLILPEVGKTGQQSLSKASVLVVGAGGLGSPVLTYLNAAGVGRIGIVDDDVVSLSNLHRQTLFSEKDIGVKKVLVASQRMTDQNQNTRIDIFDERLTAKNAFDIFRSYEIVVDASDNFPTRYLINDACVLFNKTLVYAAIHQFSGQVCVFNNEGFNNRGPNYRDLFPDPPPPGQVPNCAEAGVLGTLAGIIGSIQANEVLKLILKLEDVLDGKMLTYDALSNSIVTLKINKRDDNPISGKNPTITELLDYDAFCGVRTSEVQHISKEKLGFMMQTEKDVTIIDVRESDEITEQHYGALNLPLSKIDEQYDKIPLAGKVVFICRSGQRSANVVRRLEKMGVKGEFYSLSGGIISDE